MFTGTLGTGHLGWCYRPTRRHGRREQNSHWSKRYYYNVIKI